MKYNVRVKYFIFVLKKSMKSQDMFLNMQTTAMPVTSLMKRTIRSASGMKRNKVMYCLS